MQTQWQMISTCLEILCDRSASSHRWSADQSPPHRWSLTDRSPLGCKGSLPFSRENRSPHSRKQSGVKMKLLWDLQVINETSWATKPVTASLLCMLKRLILVATSVKPSRDLWDFFAIVNFFIRKEVAQWSHCVYGEHVNHCTCIRTTIRNHHNFKIP